MTIQRKNFLIFFLFLITGGFISACLRYELLWDLYNYHYYNGFALLNGRVGYDLAPAFIMSFFNPLLDVITYLLLCVFNENVFMYSFCTGLFFGGLLYVLYLINQLFFDANTRQGKIAIALSLIIAATGFSTWFQIGTSTNEISVSIFVLTGIYFLLKQICTEKKDFVNIFIAGFLLGSAAGLKYTAAIYCLTAGFTFLLFAKKISPFPLKALILLIIAGLSGFLIFNGYWLYLMYKNYENPFFPLFNELFKSSWFPEINTRDEVHVAGRSIIQFLTVPLEMINHTKKKGLVGFCRFTDVRFYFMYIFGAILLCLQVFKNAPRIRPQTLFLIIFIGSSFILWLFFFSIIRYVIPIETLLAVLFTASLKCIFPSSTNTFRYPFIFLCGLLFTLLCITPLASDEWKNLRASTSVLNLPTDLNPPDKALIYILNEPATHLVVDLLKKNPESRVIGLSTQMDTTWKVASAGITGYGSFKEKTKRIISQHNGTIVAIGHTSYPVFNNLCHTIRVISLVTDEKPLFYFACIGTEKEIINLFPNLYMGIINQEKTD